MTDYEEIAKKIGRLVQTKNYAYGDSFSKTAAMLSFLYPNEIRLSQYCDVAVIIRVLDKLCRVAQGNDPYGENPWEDIAGYAILRYAQVVSTK